MSKATGEEYAVKIVSRRIDCTREIGLLRACQGHPNVVRLHDVLYDEVRRPGYASRKRAPQSPLVLL